MELKEEAEVYPVPYCEQCWERGFASVARVAVGECDQRRALCISCHGDYERDKEEAMTQDEQPKLRVCLKCGHGFESTGNANRICKRCKEENARLLCSCTHEALGIMIK